MSRPNSKSAPPPPQAAFSLDLHSTSPTPAPRHSPAHCRRADRLHTARTLSELASSPLALLPTHQASAATQRPRKPLIPWSLTSSALRVCIYPFPSSSSSSVPICPLDCPLLQGSLFWGPCWVPSHFYGRSFEHGSQGENSGVCNRFRGLGKTQLFSQTSTSSADHPPTKLGTQASKHPRAPGTEIPQLSPCPHQLLQTTTKSWFAHPNFEIMVVP